VNQITGAMLRELRQQHDLGLRAVARRAGAKVRLSDGHLSRVERGHRPVTPAVIATYERALGIRIHPDLIHQLVAPHQPDGADRRAFHREIASLAASGAPMGGMSGLHHHRLHEATLIPLPTRITAADTDHLEHAALTLRRLDQRYGGELAAQMGCHLLRWAIRLCTVGMSEQTSRRLHTAVGTLAACAAWAAHDAHQPTTARTLFSLALDAAVHADQPDLRAHVLADIAAHYNHHAHPAAALHAVRLGDGDERVHPAVQCMLHGVRARTYATVDEPDRCHREIAHAEHLAATVDPYGVPGWLGGWQPAHLQALLGHARADLAQASGAPADVDRAHEHLSTAAEQLTSVRPRAAALCLTHLARLHHTCGDLDQAAKLVVQTEHLAIDLRSTRLNRDLAALQATTGGSDESPPASG
jgi:transcriptional regulator with XRE-family HTH domain